VVYVILANGASDAIDGLIRSIHNRRDLFIVHLDAKAPEETKQYLAALSRRHANIRALPSRVCSWGSFSLVDAALRATDLALTSSRTWSHLLLVSEQHYPLARSDDIATRLEDGVSCIEATEYVTFYPVGQRDIEHRFSRYFHEVEGVGSFFRSERSDDIGHVRHGSQWLVLSRRAAAYLSAQFGRDDVRSFFASSLLPDETAFPTVLMSGTEDERGRVRLAETTFVAWPHRTDNDGMIACRATFEAARAANALFIRKRPPSMEDLPEFEIAGEELSPDRLAPYRAGVRALWHRATGRGVEPVRTDPARDLGSRAADTLDYLKPRLGQFDLNDYRDAQPTTTIYLSLRLRHWPKGLRVCVLSYTLTDYAVVLVAEPIDPAADFSFDERWLGGFRTHKIKVRIRDLFMNDQIECPIPGSGIVRVADPRRPSEVVDLILEAARYADGIAA